MDNNITTIKIKRETRELLAEIGTKKETYDDIIRRLIKFYKERSKEPRNKDHFSDEV